MQLHPLYSKVLNNFPYLVRYQDKASSAEKYQNKMFDLETSEVHFRFNTRKYSVHFPTAIEGFAYNCSSLFRAVHDRQETFHFPSTAAWWRIIAFTLD